MGEKESRETLYYIVIKTFSYRKKRKKCITLSPINYIHLLILYFYIKNKFNHINKIMNQF